MVFVLIGLGAACELGALALFVRAVRRLVNAVNRINGNSKGPR